MSVNFLFFVYASFSQLLIENFIVQSVNFWFVILTLHFLKLLRSSSIMFSSLSTIKNLKPSSPRLSNNSRLFEWWISIKVHQCMPGLLCLLVLKIAKGCKRIFSFSLFYYFVKIYISCYWINWIYSHIIIFHILIFFIFKKLINF